MSEPLRAHDPGPSRPSRGGAPSPRAVPAPGDATAEQQSRTREQAEAQAALAAVLRSEDAKAARARIPVKDPRQRVNRLKAGLLATLLLFNGYAWFGQPEWLRYHEPPVPDDGYYEQSWRVAVYLQRAGIERYRREKGVLPLSAHQTGVVVHGVRYEIVDRAGHYLLQAGEGVRRYVYRSSDSLGTAVGRSLVQIGLISGGLR